MLSCVGTVNADEKAARCFICIYIHIFVYYLHYKLNIKFLKDIVMRRKSKNDLKNVVSSKDPR